MAYELSPRFQLQRMLVHSNEKKDRPQSNGMPKLGDIVVEQDADYKYLGVIVLSTLSSLNHIHHNNYCQMHNWHVLSTIV